MSFQRRMHLGLFFLVMMLAGLFPAVLHAPEKKPRRPGILIGMVSSMVRDVPDPLQHAALKPFRTLMESQTGLRGTIVVAGDPFQLTARLHGKKLQLGVFHGFEFAWARQKDPELRPLLIAINEHRYLHAVVVVPKRCETSSLADLKGKTIAVPYGTREHCLLFLERSFQTLGNESGTEAFRMTKPPDIETALDAVARGKVDGALVDGVALACYKKQKPGCYAKLKIVARSKVFPAAVTAYHVGGVSKAILKRFRVGMINANKNAYGRQLLTLWKMTGFERVPADYDKILEDIARAYPAPQPFEVGKKREVEEVGSR